MGQAGLDAAGGAVSLDQLAKVRGMAPISLEQYAACLARLVELPGRVVSPLPLGVRQLRACVPDESLPALSELVLPAAAAPCMGALLTSCMRVSSVCCSHPRDKCATLSGLSQRGRLGGLLTAHRQVTLLAHQISM